MKSLIESRAFMARLAVILVLAYLYRGFPMFWYSPEVRARVMTEDGKPVVNAVVVASWNASARRSGFTHGQVALFEVSTDKDGWFRVPAWGPILLLEGRVIEDDPTIFIFHPDFAPLKVSNKEVGMHPAWPIIHFRYQDQALTLARWPAEREKRERALSYVSWQFRRIFSTPPMLAYCSKKYVPRMLATMREAKVKQIGKGSLLDGLESFGTGEYDHTVCFAQPPPDWPHIERQ